MVHATYTFLFAAVCRSWSGWIEAAGSLASIQLYGRHYVMSASRAVYKLVESVPTERLLVSDMNAVSYKLLSESLDQA